MMAAHAGGGGGIPPVGGGALTPAGVAPIVGGPGVPPVGGGPGGPPGDPPGWPPRGGWPPAGVFPVAAEPQPWSIGQALPAVPPGGLVNIGKTIIQYNPENAHIPDDYNNLKTVLYIMLNFENGMNLPPNFNQTLTDVLKELTSNIRVC